VGTLLLILVLAEKAQSNVLRMFTASNGITAVGQYDVLNASSFSLVITLLRRVGCVKPLLVALSFAKSFRISGKRGASDKSCLP